MLPPAEWGGSFTGYQFGALSLLTFNIVFKFCGAGPPLFVVFDLFVDGG